MMMMTMMMMIRMLRRMMMMMIRMMTMMLMRRFRYEDARFGGQAYGTGYREMSDSRFNTNFSSSKS